MYAIEFEADIKNGMVKIPSEYTQLEDSHARILVMVSDQASLAIEKSSLDFSNVDIQAFKEKGAVVMQREMRDEW